MSQTDTKASRKLHLFRLIIFIVIVVLVTIFSYSRYEHVLERTKTELSEKVIDYHMELFKKVAQTTTAQIPGYLLEELLSDARQRDAIETHLRLVRSSAVENLFVIFHDTDTSFAFLLDSESDTKTRAQLGEPFEPLSGIWDKAFTSGEVQIYRHSDGMLWISVVIPIRDANRTVALLGADISHVVDETMTHQLALFGELFLWITAIGLSWFLLMYVLVLYFREKYHEGYLDPLTQVYNRKYLYDNLLKRLNWKYQLILLDVDYFKKINDTYGHTVGDEVLKAISSRLKNLIRPEDILIRFGGEEFLIYATGLSETMCHDFAERLRRGIGDTPIVIDGASYHVTISLGVHPFASNVETFSHLIKLTDTALYEAKADGRDRSCFVTRRKPPQLI